jgi:hypothetical protein
MNNRNWEEKRVLSVSESSGKVNLSKPIPGRCDPLSVDTFQLLSVIFGSNLCQEKGLRLQRRRCGQKKCSLYTMLESQNETDKSNWNFV